MKLKVLVLAALLTGIFILNGCKCPCNGDSPTATCPMPGQDKPVSSSVTLESSWVAIR